MQILGVDEAGRGSVIGPLVIAGILLEHKNLQKLKEIGVRDSKELSLQKREELYKKLKNIASDWVIIKIPASRIDQLRKRKNLNLIEAEQIAEIIRHTKPDIAYIDAPQISVEKFKAILISLTKTKSKIICANYAEKKYKIVAAASVMAKVERDREIEKIKREVNFDFGVGYPHDPRSIKFVKFCLKEGKNLKWIRRSWITVRELEKKQKQRSLSDFK